jgi:hypothetical protein
MLFAAAMVGVLSYAIWVWARTEPEDPKARRVGPFLATPYLQLGEDPKPDDLTLLWHADDVDAAWSVEVQGDPAERSRASGSASWAILNASAMNSGPASFCQLESLR